MDELAPFIDVESQLRASFIHGAQFDPAQRAKQQKVASLVGVEPDAIGPDPVAFAREFSAQNNDYSGMVAKAPNVAKTFVNPRNAELMHLDIDRLMNMEQKHKSLVDIERERLQTAVAKQNRGVASSLALKLAGSIPTLLNVPRKVGQAAAYALFSPETAAGITGAMDALHPMGTVLDSAESWYEGNVRPSENVFLKGENGEEKINWSAMNPFRKEGVYNLLSAVAGEAAPMAAQIGLTAATGGLGAVGFLAKAPTLAKFAKLALSPAAVTNSARVAAGAFDDGVKSLVAKGYSLDDAKSAVAPGALLAGLFSTLAGSPLEAHIIEQNLARLAASKTGGAMARKIAVGLKTAAAQATKEGAQETIEGLGEDLAKWLTYQPDMTMKEVAANMFSNFAGGAAMGGVMGGAFQSRGAIRAQAQTEFFDSLHDAASKAKYMKDAPEAHRDLVESLTKDGPVKDLFIPVAQWQTYWQQHNEDPQAKAAEVGVTPEDFAMAVERKGDLVVPTSEFATKIAGTEHYDNVVPMVRTNLLGPTILEQATANSNEKEVESFRKQVADEPQSAERDAIRDQIVQDLTLAQSVYKGKSLEMVANEHAGVIMALSRRYKKSPTEILQRNRLAISTSLRTDLEQAGIDPDATIEEEAANAKPDGGPDLGSENAGVQEPSARRDAGPVVGGSNEVRSGLPGQGQSPSDRVWHGTETDPELIVALKAAGLSRNQLGGMGPGLHVTAGPDVALGYAKGNQRGLWKAALRDLVPFDAATDTTHSVETLASLGIKAAHEMTGAEAWDALVLELGEDAAVAHLREKGFNGLYYNHGGEDAWAVWDDSSIRGSQLTNEAQARAEYARQGSRRDELGFLKAVAQTMFQPATNRELLRTARKIYQEMDSPKLPQFRAAVRASIDSKAGDFEYAGEKGDAAWRALLAHAAVKEMPGAPANIRTPLDREALKRQFIAQALEGEVGRFWYDDSAQAFLDAAHGDHLEALKMASLAALYSPQTDVPDNGRRAVLAYYDAKHKMAVEPGGVAPRAKVKAQKIMDATSPEEVLAAFEGQKINSFQQNLIDLFMPGVDPNAVTIDIWMMRAAGYDNETPSSTQYAWMRELVQEVAAELGWRPKEAQAGIWIAQKAKQEKTDLPTAAKHYGDAMLRVSAQFNAESMPGSSSRAQGAPGIERATPEQIHRYHTAKMAAVVSAFKAAGVALNAQTTGFGYWEGESNPVTAFFIPLPHVGSVSDGTLGIGSQAERELVGRLLFDVLGDQDAIGLMRPYQAKTMSASNGMLFALEREITVPEMAKLADAFYKLGYDAWIDAADPKNIKFVHNSKSWVATPKAAKKFHVDVLAIMEAAGIKGDEWKFSADTDLITEGLNENYLEGLPAERASAVRDGLSRGRKAVAAANATLQSDLASSDNGTLIGVHYSPAEGLTELDPTLYGKGAAGVEQRRLAGLSLEQRARSFFYEVKDGRVPPKEAVVRGANKYQATLRNIYDLDVDPLGLRGEANNINDLEKKIVEAGFRGYVATAPGMDARGIVVLGTDKVPVQAVDAASVKVVFQSPTSAPDTRSPEFKAWFGTESNLVNPDGSPMVVYHGTERGGFTEFRPSKTGAMGPGIYFGTAPESAVGYAGDGNGSQMIPVYLRGKYLDNYQWTEYISKNGWAGAKEAAIKDGFSGVVDSKFEDAVVVWNPTDIKSALSNTGAFDPSNPSILHQPGDDKAPRGALQWAGPNGNRTFNLALLKEDRSTVFHELGHFYLEVISDLATMPNASPEAVEDFGRIMKWLGVSSREEITREHHEKFADGHLAYLLHGKAPVASLIPAFKRFSQWLTTLSKKLATQGRAMLGVQVEMSDEVKDIFDRLYATDEEIAAAEETMPDLFASAEDMGITQAEFDVLRKKKAAGIEEAHDKLLNRLMRQLALDDRKERRAEKIRIREEVTAEIDASPEYVALATLASGEHGKLNTGLLIDMYGEATVKAMDKRVMSANGELVPDAAATLTGMEVGDLLVQALTNLPARKVAIATETNSRFRAAYPTALDDGTLRAKAISAANGDARGEVLEAELAVLGHKADQILAKEAAKQTKASELRGARHTATVKSIRAAAIAHLDAKPLHTINPWSYFQAQQKASREAYQLALRKDYVGARSAQERSILNHHLFNEANKRLDRQETIREWVTKHDSAKARTTLAKAGDEYLAQYDALRDRFSVEREPNVAIERKKTLAKFAEDLRAQDQDAVIDPELLDESRTKNWREFTPVELEGFYSALRNIYTLANREVYALVEGQRIEHAAILDDIIETAKANTTKLKELMLGSDPRRKGLLHRAKTMLRGADASMVKMELIAHWLDGDKGVNGPFHKYVWNRIAKAEGEEYAWHAKLTAKMVEVMESIPKERLHSYDTDLFQVGGMGPVSRGQILTMLLYSGQPERRQKLVEGYASRGLTDGDLTIALGKLDQHDIALANRIWSLFDEFGPEVREMEKRLTGSKPEWTAPTPISLPGGEATGGYFPLVHDTKAPGHGMAEKQQGGTVGELFGNGYVRARTSTSHVQELTNATYPLMLDYRFVLTGALANQIKDLTHREAVLDIRRIFENKGFKKMVQETLGEEYQGQFMPWLAHVVNERNAGYARATSQWSQILTGLRGNAVAAMLGFKATSVILQVLDLPRVTKPGVGQVKGRFLTQGLAEWMAHPVKVSKEIDEKSPQMRFRAENLDRDMRTKFQQAHGDMSWIARWNRKSYKGLTAMDYVTSRIAWWGSYKQALAEGADEKTAVLRADETTRMKLQSGSPKDLAAITRSDNEMMKLLTMFMGDATPNYTMLRDLGHNISGMKGIPAFTYAAMTLMAAQMLADLLRGQGPDDDEDEVEWAVRKAMLAPASTVPFVRDLANSVDGVLQGDPMKAEYRFTPLITVATKGLQSLASTKKLLNDDEEWEDWGLKQASFMGYAFGVGGTSQAEATAKYLRRYQTGDEDPANAAQFLFDAGRGKRRER